MIEQQQHQNTTKRKTSALLNSTGRSIGEADRGVAALVIPPPKGI
jgi:hypothetical protein